MRIPEEVAENVLLLLVQEGMLVTNNCNLFFFFTTSEKLKNSGRIALAQGTNLPECAKCILNLRVVKS